MQRILTVLVLASLCLYGHANEGDPLAVRFWPGDCISVETHGGLRVAVFRDDVSAGEFEGDVDRKILLSDTVDHVLARPANQDRPTWQDAPASKPRYENDMSVVSANVHAAEAIAIDVDGVRILIAEINAAFDSSDAKPARKNVDTLILLGNNHADTDASDVATFVRSIAPRSVMLNRSNRKFASELAQSLELDSAIVESNQNTVAVSRVGETRSNLTLVLMSDETWAMPAEMHTLFTAMEHSCRESQDVFAKLSATQMNFKPSNGSHTPRWNAEHMMGRQLQFFSQIYHAIDTSIPVMDLNPKQMPPDYVAAHPDWDGAEEARQMQRVSDFCRRFAYLLQDVGIDDKPPASRWPSLRALLLQMQRHYDEHTSNTIKKFDLPDWPS